MADGTQVVAGSGDTIWTEDTGDPRGKIQRTKVVVGNLDADNGDVSSSNPMPVTGRVTTTAAQGTLTDRSGTITTGGTAQTLATANSSRQYLFIQNNSTGTLWFNYTTTAVQSQPSIQLPLGASMSFQGPYITTELVSIIGATTGQTFSAKEG